MKTAEHFCLHGAGDSQNNCAGGDDPDTIGVLRVGGGGNGDLSGNGTEQTRCFIVGVVIGGALRDAVECDGNVVEKKYRGSYFFVHTQELRDAYDTYKVIHTLSKEGFKEKPLEINNYNTTNVITSMKKVK